MTIMTALGTGQGYLKAGFLGFQKSGKTYTAAKLAIGTRAFFGLTGPVAMFDTEGGSEYIAPLILKETGVALQGIRSRSFDDLMTAAQECVAAEISILIVDSVTHVWRELCDAYMKQLNEKLVAQKRTRRQRLEFQDWAQVKGIWNGWTDFYVNSPLHIIICGRAGFEYNMEENEDTGRKELQKVGIKMKVEGEFGFEPSLLVEMDRVQESNGSGGFVLRRQATVLGDRFGVIDGKEAYDPDFEFFRPHIEMLKPGAHAPINVDIKTKTGVDMDGDTDWARERKTRAILCEEIQGELVNAYPGQTAPEKKAKTDLIYLAFSTRSWTAVESMQSLILRRGLALIRKELGVKEATPEELFKSEEPDAAADKHPPGTPAKTEDPNANENGPELFAEEKKTPEPEQKTAIPGIDVPDESQKLAALILEEKAKLKRQPSDAQWKKICKAEVKVEDLTFADPAALADFLGFVKALVAIDAEAVEKVKKILDKKE
jgi:hypothetical protein